jgi:hypothetical protein
MYTTKMSIPPDAAAMPDDPPLPRVNYDHLMRVISRTNASGVVYFTTVDTSEVELEALAGAGQVIASGGTFLTAVVDITLGPNRVGIPAGERFSVGAHRQEGTHVGNLGSDDPRALTSLDAKAVRMPRVGWRPSQGQWDILKTGDGLTDVAPSVVSLLYVHKGKADLLTHDDWSRAIYDRMDIFGMNK